MFIVSLHQMKPSRSQLQTLTKRQGLEAVFLPDAFHIIEVYNFAW